MTALRISRLLSQWLRRPLRTELRTSFAPRTRTTPIDFDPEVNSERLAELQQRLGDRIQLGLGCDFHLSYENITDALKNPTKYSINKTGYLLVEFPDFGIAQNMADTFYELELAKLTPIITHPNGIRPSLTGRNAWRSGFAMDA